MQKSIWISTAALAFASLLALEADAALRLRIEDMNSPPDSPPVGVVLTDDGDGLLSFSGIIGQFNVFISGVASKPAIGGQYNYSELDLVTMSINTSAAGSLRLVVFDDGFHNAPDSQLSLITSIGGTITGNINNTVVAQSWVNPSNGVLDLGPDQLTAGNLQVLDLGAPGVIPANSVMGMDSVFSPTAFSGSNSVPFAKSGPYSVFAAVTANFTSTGGTVSYDLNLQVVPEPGSMAIWGGFAVVAGLFAIRRGRKS